GLRRELEPYGNPSAACLRILPLPQSCSWWTAQQAALLRCAEFPGPRPADPEQRSALEWTRSNARPRQRSRPNWPWDHRGEKSSIACCLLILCSQLNQRLKTSFTAHRIKAVSHFRTFAINPIEVLYLLLKSLDGIWQVIVFDGCQKCCRETARLLTAPFQHHVGGVSVRAEAVLLALGRYPCNSFHHRRDCFI